MRSVAKRHHTWLDDAVGLNLWRHTCGELVAVTVLKISGIYKQVNVDMEKPAKFTQIYNQCRLLSYLASLAR
jgi:hypothetical protein